MKKVKIKDSYFSKYDLLDKFQAYQSEAAFTSGNKSTHQMVAMSDVEKIIDELVSGLTK
ncbi:MAG: hypothetical protein V4608_14715 [Bacteroidota bacterium]